MAKDVNGKHISNNNSGNTSPSISDQQKVPPLRIVLNTAGNQKSSRDSAATAAIANQQQQQPHQQQQDIKKDKSQQDNVKSDVLKSGGRVRIKLGSGKQTNKSTNSSSSESSSNKSSNEDAQKLKSTAADRQDNNSTVKEDLTTTSYSHLRRITRRSQRTVQTVSNEDEESISSMTSIDENQSTNNINSDNNNSQEATSVTTTQPNETTSSSTTTTTANSSTNNNGSTSNTSSNADTPRRYKRKRGETSECSLGEHDGLFGFQNYKLPIQNSFELYKNIRKQVDKKLRSLITIHPKAPYGFRDYMLTRGAYLLDGNKLGNGINLFMNEDGGLHPAPIGKYHALRHNRVNYSVPNRAKVPLGLPVNSPLYNLFIDQEKERYKIRMQHIKEREKLTLAAEQEIMRVYNQAAMAAANQVEPFSACTMLKHQEIYNYMDSDGYAIQANEDLEQDGVKQEGVRTRRRQHEHISPPTSRKNFNTEEKDDTTSEINQKESAKSPDPHTSSADDDIQKSRLDQSKMEEITNVKNSDDCSTNQQSSGKETITSVTENQNEITENKERGDEASNLKKDKTDEIEKITTETSTSKEIRDLEASGTSSEKTEDKVVSGLEPKSEGTKETSGDKVETSTNELKRIKMEPYDESETSDEINDSNDTKKMDIDHDCPTLEKRKEKSIEDTEDQEKDGEKNSSTLNDSADTELINESDFKLDSKEQQNALMEQSSVSSQVVLEEGQETTVLSDDDRRAYNKEVFLSQLQDMDDKWDKIRSEMLNRHRHEAESLHAVQKLEWEWKTKEIGACDVGTTQIIDNTLVPKLSIYPQDY